MNILSLFDGISCGQVALKRAGIKYDKYYASEIDKNAIAITQYNFPATIQLGDVRQVNSDALPEIDLLWGGSPCQDLSIAGKRKGLKGEKSILFWEFVRLLKEIKPKYFLFENVASMSKKNCGIISSVLGVEPIKINSASVSAQNRVRYYWTNINNGEIAHPGYTGKILQSILENGYTEKLKSYVLPATYFRQNTSEVGLNIYFRRGNRQLVFSKPIYFHGGDAGNRGLKKYSIDDKIVYITPNSSLSPFVKYARKLTPIECERLQTLPDDYTKYGRFGNKIKEISKTARYRCLGNGWTVDVICHILKYIKKED